VNEKYEALARWHTPSSRNGAVDWCVIDGVDWPCLTAQALDDLATLQSFYQATVRLEVELGRPETVDIERVLGITPPVLTNFWATFDAVHTEQRV